MPPDVGAKRTKNPEGSFWSQMQSAVDNHRFVLACRTGWSAAYPQSAHLLREEVLAGYRQQLAA